MGTGLPKVTPSHEKDQWLSAPAAASPFSCLNFLFDSSMCRVKNPNPATLFRFSHTDDESCLPTAVLHQLGHNQRLAHLSAPTSWLWSSSFSQLMETYHCNAFPSKLFAVFQDSFLQWSAYPFVWSWMVFLAGYCSVRPFMHVTLWNQHQDFCGEAGQRPGLYHSLSHNSLLHERCKLCYSLLDSA